MTEEELIQKWSGANAQVWDYGVTQNILRIKFVFPNVGNIMVLTLKNCSRIAFVPGWEKSKIEISDYMSEFGVRYRVSDGENLNVDCGACISNEYQSYTDIPPPGW